MRTPRRSATLPALVLACCCLVAGAGAAATAAAGDPAGRAAPSIVVLRAPSVADRVRAAGGQASERDERSWSADAFHAQEEVLALLARAGTPVRPGQRYLRALNGFAAALTAAQIAALEREPAVAGVYPSRHAAALAVTQPRGGSAPAQGLDGGGVVVAAIGGSAAHAAALAARVAVRAPGSTTLPVSLPGHTTTEGLLAALERALDPDGDGDCHDAPRVIVLGVVEPLAALPDAPSARAVAGAAALDAVVVVPVGDDGAAGPVYGSRAGPSGSPAVLAVAPVEVRGGTVRVSDGSSTGLAPGGAGGGAAPALLAPGGRSADVAADLAADVALLVEARPGLRARTVRALVEGSARSVAAGALADLAASLAAEVAVELSPLGADGTGIATVRNVSTRPLRLTAAIEGAGGVLPRALALRPGASARIVVRAGARGAAAAGSAVHEGALVVTPEGGAPARVRRTFVAPRSVPLLAGVTLTPAAASGAVWPAHLALRAGAVLGSGATRELRPLARLDVELWAGPRRVGLLARLRDVLPGRYVFALTGRGPDGAPLRPGRYRLRLVAVPADATPAQQRNLTFVTSAIARPILSR